jgi:hypothetical protein
MLAATASAPLATRRTFIPAVAKPAASEEAIASSSSTSSTSMLLLSLTNQLLFSSSDRKQSISKKLDESWIYLDHPFTLVSIGFAV